jgi:hypothetical protein
MTRRRHFVCQSPAGQTLQVSMSARWMAVTFVVHCNACVRACVRVRVLPAQSPRNHKRRYSACGGLLKQKTAAGASSSRNASTASKDIVRPFDIFIRHTWTPCTSDRTHMDALHLGPDNSGDLTLFVPITYRPVLTVF